MILNSTCANKAHPHLVQGEGVAVGEVLVVVHVLGVRHKGLQGDAGVAVAVQDLVVELCGTVSVPAAISDGFQPPFSATS